MKNYYKILGVAPKASQAEIKKAYRMLAVKYHPDKNSGDKVSEERFKEILESYIILGDVAKRNAYDYTTGHYKNYGGQAIESGKPTPITYLLLFKRIKDKVLNANGYVNKTALFKVLDDLLSEENINFLINVRDTATNNLIIDEVLTSCIFLNDPLRSDLYIKLKKLSDGDPRFTEKVNLLNNRNYTFPKIEVANTKEESLSKTAILLFIGFLIFFMALALLASI